MFAWLKAMWRNYVSVVWKRQTQRSGARPSEGEGIAVFQAAPPLESAPPKDELDHEHVMLVNRAARRKYERARRRHDKFVKKKARAERTAEPHEPRPTPAPTETKPEEIIEGLISDEDLVANHFEGGDPVLYEASESWGEFNFRDTILQQLDKYFFYLRRMKRLDPDAYSFYRQVGANLVPYLSISFAQATRPIDKPEPRQFPDPLEHRPLPTWFNETRPAFGCIAYGTDPQSEQHELKGYSDTPKHIWVPKFVFFTKYKMPPCELQPMSGGDIYKLTVWWDRPDKHRYGVPQEFGIFVSTDGKTIKALKSFDRHGHAFWREWAIPYEFEQWARQRGVKPQEFLRDLFVEAVDKATYTGLSMARINVTNRDGMVAVFGVNIKRMSYFFQDRETTGRKIFHIVKPHQRSDGTFVKLHFRGEREFEWAGYHVLVTVPGLHHPDIGKIREGFISEEWDDGQTMSLPELGEKIHEIVHRPTA